MTTTAVSVPLTEEQQFLEERRSGIGGSDIHQLLNEPEYGRGCARWLMYDKLGVKPDYPPTISPGFAKRGKKMEAIIADEYEEATGRKVRRQPLRRHPDYPWGIVHFDRQVLAGSGFPGLEVSKTGALEIKSFGDWAFRKLLREGARGATMMQIQHSCFVAGYEWTAFAGMNVVDFDLRHFDVPRDEAMIDTIKKAGDWFWTLKEKGQLPPPLEDPEDVRCRVCTMRRTCRGQELDKAAAEALEKGKELVQIENPALRQNLEDLDAVKIEQKAVEALRVAIETKIGEQLDEFKADAIQVPGFRVYYRPGSTSRLDADALKGAQVIDLAVAQLIGELEGNERYSPLVEWVKRQKYDNFYRRGIPTKKSLRVYAV